MIKDLNEKLDKCIRMQEKYAENIRAIGWAVSSISGENKFRVEIRDHFHNSLSSVHALEPDCIVEIIGVILKHNQQYLAENTAKIKAIQKEISEVENETFKSE